MLESDITYIVFALLIFMQSIAGVGILVIGTPSMLLMDFNMIEILNVLLPISIITSFLNLIIIRVLHNKNKIYIDKKFNFLFFIICVPSIFIGLMILRNFENLIKFEYLVSSVILFSVIITNLKAQIIKISEKFKISYLFITGTIHGITNSGGSLLSLLISSQQNKENSRYNITFFYFFLASFQYLIFINIFEIDFFNFDLFKLCLILFVGIILGNIISKFLNKNYFRLLINVLSLVSCFFLIIKSSF
jgi:uncharacterized protein